MKLGIVDVGLSNIGALQGAMYSEGWDTHLVRTPEAVTSLTHLVLPGVGSFHEAMLRLDNSGLSQAIWQFAGAGKPLLGICLGMHLLATYGDEGGGRDGLSLVPGYVRRLNLSSGLRLPHVGWNSVEQQRLHPIFDGIKSGIDFYFVHSYYFDVENTEHQIGRTEYGDYFTSCISYRNVVGVQFHPEKSQRNGLRLLDNFCRWDGNA